MPILEVWSLDAGESINYCFYSDNGDPQFYDHPNDDKLAATDFNDHIHFDPEDGYVASGHTGNEYGDAWKLESMPTGFVQYGGNSDVQLIYDGDDVTDELLEQGMPDFINVEGIKDWVVGTYNDVAFDNGGGSGDDGSSTGGTIIHDFENNDLSAYNSISDADAQWLFTDSSTGDVIGGLHNYTDTIAESDADVTVSTQSELVNVLQDSGRDGQTVYITNDIDISSYSGTIDVNSSVTVAGDRGIDGSPGPKIISNKNENRHFEIWADNVRFTGWRLEGPMSDWASDGNDSTHHKGIIFDGSGGEIDNMEVYGFGYACIIAGNDTHIHHSNIHHGPTDGWGYGVSTSGSELIEYNRFAQCRHMIAEENGSWGSYTIRDNIFEPPPGGVVTDAHDGGTDMRIFHNDYVAYDPDHAPSWTNHSDYIGGHQIRDVPRNDHVILSNWFANPEAPDPTPTGSFTFRSIYPAGDTSDWTNITYEPSGAWDSDQPNHYDNTSYPTDGAGCRDGTTVAPDSTSALKVYPQGSYQQIQSTSGLDVYPQVGDTFEFHFLKSATLANWQGAFLFGVQDDSTLTGHYEVDMGNGSVSLQLDEEGTPSGDDITLGSMSVDIQANTAYKVRIDWPSNPASSGISVELFNVSGMSNSLVDSFTADPDDTYTSGGIGFFANFYPTTYFDTVQFS